MIEQLRGYAGDPMWDAHAEVPKMVLNAAANRIEELEAALHIAFMAMCAQRDNPDDEVFQDAIDALGMATSERRCENE